MAVVFRNNGGVLLGTRGRSRDGTEYVGTGVLRTRFARVEVVRYTFERPPYRGTSSQMEYERYRMDFFKVRILVPS